MKREKVKRVGADMCLTYFAISSRGPSGICFDSSSDGQVEAETLVDGGKTETIITEGLMHGQVWKVRMVQFDDAERARLYIKNMPDSERVLRHYKRTEGT